MQLYRFIHKKETKLNENTKMTNKKKYIYVCNKGHSIL